MPEKFSPFNSISYGWEYGEDNWNIGMDANLKKVSYMLDGNIDGVVTSIPSVVENGKAYFDTSTNRLLYGMEGVWQSFTPPKWFRFTDKLTGDSYTYNGLTLVETPNPLDVLVEPTGAAGIGFVDPATKATDIQGFVDNVFNKADDTLGSALIGYRGRSAFAKMSDFISVKDEGAKGDGTTDDSPAFQSAINKLQAAGGGKLFIPKGTYRLTKTLNMQATSSGWHNLVVMGDGVGTTVLDFSTAVAGSDGIGIFGWGGRLRLSSFTLKNAPLVGINCNKGVLPGSESYISRVSMDNLVVDGCGSDGLRFVQVYMGTFNDIESRNNGDIGFNLLGFHTSMVFNRCWAGGDAVYPNGGNLGAGWKLNGLTYSKLISCSADWNGGQGYLVQNTAGFSIDSCGAESNSQEGWFVRSGFDTSGMPALAIGVSGFSLNNCFALNNGKAAANTYANFLAISANSGQVVKVSTNHCVDHNDLATFYSHVFTSNSGTLVEYTSTNNTLRGTTAKSGTGLDIQNNSVVGKSALARFTTDFLVPDGVTTIVPMTYFEKNRLGASIAGGGIVIPSGVNRIRATGSLFFDTNAAGFRSITFRKNGSNFAGNAVQKTTSDGYGNVSITSAVVEVVEGDIITVAGTQTSGINLNVLAASLNTFLSVEAVG